MTIRLAAYHAFNHNNDGFFLLSNVHACPTRGFRYYHSPTTYQPRNLDSLHHFSTSKTIELIVFTQRQ